MKWTVRGAGAILAACALTGVTLGQIGVPERGTPEEAAPLERAEGKSAARKWLATVKRLTEPLIEAQVVPGLVVGVYDRGKVEFYGFGKISASDPRVPDENTIFEIGSITKVFTGILLAEAVRRGEVELSDPLEKFLPETVTVPRYGEQSITLLHLATHRSALRRIPSNIPQIDLRDPYAGYDVEKLHAFFDGYSMTAPPGGSYGYSNLGMGLLGQILAEQGKATYPELLRARVLTPLGMKETGVRLSPEEERRAATPHRDGFEVEPWQFDALCGCGGIRSTAADMVKFIEWSVGGGDPIEPLPIEPLPIAESLALARKPVDDNMGLGWHIAGDRSTLYHNGQTGGFSTGLLLNPVMRKGVIVLANEATTKVDTLAEQIIQVMYGMKVAAQKFPQLLEVTQEGLERFVGDFSSPHSYTISITTRGGALFAQLTGQSAYRVYPLSKARFAYRDIPAELEFEMGEEGGEGNAEEGGEGNAEEGGEGNAEEGGGDRERKPARSVILHQNGRATRCERAPGEGSG